MMITLFNSIKKNFNTIFFFALLLSFVAIPFVVHAQEHKEKSSYNFVRAHFLMAHYIKKTVLDICEDNACRERIYALSLTSAYASLMQEYNFLHEKISYTMGRNGVNLIVEIDQSPVYAGIYDIKMTLTNGKISEFKYATFKSEGFDGWYAEIEEDPRGWITQIPQESAVIETPQLTPTDGTLHTKLP